ncbi:SIR2 family NAD-dependent protein deacylase [Rhizosphaericola mali]|uniref:protein acetyllysine N-acetyltransferase n=1 Tax=Rhizosphaericola mali TaxID=2545455 RepID=A0A5P2G8F7_9BACT|nr:NAD-dependent deacylase [Rhizosphaericola mali]QES89503.1 NAD-dependent deacylase [Rhizosphaericola mali]
MKTKIVVLTEAGVSAESGIATFRDSNGLWENHSVEAVASPAGWKRNSALVLEFYNQRRRQLKMVEPNAAHIYLAKLEEKYVVTIITQNVDNLHERAGSSHIIHLHGSLTEVKSEKNDALIYPWTKDVKLGDLAEDGAQLRPNIVWFGEMVPKIEDAVREAKQADVFIVIGTSLQVYPAASLMEYAPIGCPVYVIDPHLELNDISENVHIIHDNATNGVLQLPL